ncbi:MAG TPA: hypothetical protein VGN18_02995 [Jatrophihabitans sp.]|uniref:hypothetical protein n=1 Tax=Jatrophihabitans sp. TaxID=1932789 RepID=UPI002DFC1F52|nr:hypothetical protein [Jatrophihabitans sp.]
MVEDLPATARRRPGRRTVVALGCALVLAVAGVGYLTLKPTTSPKPTAAPATHAAPSPTLPSPTPTPTVTRRPVARAPHDDVAPAGPTAFRFAGKAFTITAHVCGMPNIRPLDPPGEQHHTVCWVDEGFGVAPGSNSATTYVLGHSWGQDDLEVLNQASSLATREVLKGSAVTTREGVKIWPVKQLDGYLMTLRTPKGTLTYRVGQTFGVHKLDAGRLTSVMNDKVRNRIVLITCAELNHTDYDYNIISFAYLVASQRAAASKA